jgi:hypothetical protein
MGRSFTQLFAVKTGDSTSEEASDEPEVPSWAGPPSGELGECVPLSIIVARSETAVVALRHATAFSTGVTFEFIAVGRGLRVRDTNRLFHDQHLDGLEDEDPPDTFLRIGIELADGSRISNLGNPHRHLWQPGEEPESPLFVPHAGGGGYAGAGAFALNPGYWLWPLPPPGPLHVFVEWPVLGVALSRVELDAAPIIEAAGRSRRLWES